MKGLETNEKYVFAIAAYSSHGKLVGDAVGEATKPILVYPPLSAVTARMFLTQVDGTSAAGLASCVFPLSSYLVISDEKNNTRYSQTPVIHVFPLLQFSFHKIGIIPS